MAPVRKKSAFVQIPGHQAGEDRRGDISWEGGEYRVELYDVVGATCQVDDRGGVSKSPGGGGGAHFLTPLGDADRVTDPDLSKQLHDSAESKDKTIKLYEGMWHTLTTGEPEENIDKVFGDIKTWLDERC
ncbi:hypothetical protein TrCOL_g8709 [Triparma columacea]|uniref:Serine aminopeptidase S33 domain-containing protein n=1 Tax=Triparma columacea TaxID=722753 RepID=A0A9W7LBX0_9STRA|nr:hypothetical protein TrCOL_g8709 [Triparma columacea]